MKVNSYSNLKLQVTSLSMAKVKEQNVPQKLSDSIPDPSINIDPWWSGSDHWNNEKWAKEYNVYGVRFFFLFKAPFDSKSQAELSRDIVDNANFGFCGICVLFSDSGNFYSVPSSDLSTIITKINSEIRQDSSESDIVKLFNLTKASTKNPLNYIK